MKGLCYALWVFILLSPISCTKSTVILTLDHAAEIMNEKPDSAKAVLDSIKRSELRTRATRARFALLYSQAMDKCYIDTNNDSLISVALKYYSKQGTDHEKALAFYYNGVVYRNSGNIKAEVNALLDAKKYADKTNDSYIKGLIYSELARLYKTQRQYEKSIQLYKEAATEYEKVGNNTNIMFAYMAVSSSLSAIGKNLEAKNYSIKAYETAKQINAVQHIIRLGINISMQNKELYDYKIAEYLSVIRSHKELFSDDIYRLYGILYELNNQSDSAKYYYKKYVDNISPHTRISAGIISIIADLAKTTGNYKEAFEYERRYSNIADSINKADQNSIIQNLENKYIMQQAENSYKSLNKQYKLSRVIYSLIVIILIMNIIYAIRTYKNKLHCKQRDFESYVVQHETQYGNLQTQYNTLLKQIENYTIMNKEHRIRIAETLKNRMDSLRILSEFAYKYGASNPNKFYEKFHEHIVITKSEDDNLADDIIQAADMLNNGITSYLKKSYPQMTKLDLAYCGLISLGFTPESIRMIYNHTHMQSLYTARYRIRTKIRQNTTNIRQDLEDYILQISNILKDR